MQFLTSNTGYLVLWFLLPIIPALICFKVLKGKAVVSGPFKGFNLDLSGAFAGYFLLFIIPLKTMTSLIRPHENPYVVWKIKGAILDSTNVDISAVSNPSLTLIPSTQIKNGEFNVDIIGTRLGKNQVQFPDISVAADRYVSTNLESLDYQEDQDAATKQYWEMDFANHVARLKSGFKLRLDPIVNHFTTLASNPNLYVLQDQ
jgi:hypothetical protein